MEEKDTQITVKDLPLHFQVKYLGNSPAKGLWGIKHTRTPVKDLVERAKNLGKNEILPLVKVVISEEGFSFSFLTDRKKQTTFKVDTISYGVQDLIFTRVFCMIVVKDEDLKEGLPFVCHAFACDSKNQARQITYALAAAFQLYGQKVKEVNDGGSKIEKKKFAIDLRTAQEIEDDDSDETEA